MLSRQLLPRLWLMTDERMGDGLLPAIERLPSGSGIVFRHYRQSPIQRRLLFDEVRAIANASGHLLLLAGPADLADDWGADGSHGRGSAHGGLRSAPAHNLIELRAAERAGAALAFLSPVFATQSHPGTPPLGLAKFSWLARRTRLPVIALGGVTPERGRRLMRR